MTTIQKRKAFATDFTSFVDKLEGAKLADPSERYDPAETLPPPDVADLHKLEPIIKAIDYMHGQAKSKTSDDPSRRIDELINEYSGKFLQCDRVFGLFCLYCTRIVSRDFYREIVLFLSLYREVLNDKGWEKFNSVAEPSHQRHTDEPFCVAQTAEFVPDLANSFITDYFPQIGSEHSAVHQPQKLKFLGLEELPLSNVIQLIQHLCNWLHINKFSEGKVEVH